MRVRLLLLVLLFAAVASRSLRKVDPVAQKLSDDLQKYCPYFDFDGKLFCPSTSAPLKQGNNNIISGLGYNRVTRQIRFPVLANSQVQSLNDQQFFSVRYSSFGDFLNQFLGTRNDYQGGLFVLSNDVLASMGQQLYGDYRIDMGIVQKYYRYFSSNVDAQTNKQFIPEFTQILQTLPKSYDPNNATSVFLYRSRIIDLFGTEVTVNTLHGGVIYQQTALKSCFGGSTTQDMISEIDTIISKQPTGPLSYLNFRKLGLFDIKGGNPEIQSDNMPDRIASFAQNPAITQFTSVPLYSIIEDTDYQASVKAAIDHYISEQTQPFQAIIGQIEQQKVATYLAGQNVFIYNRQTEQYGNILYWTQCPYTKNGRAFYTPRCTFLNTQAGINAGQTVTAADLIYNGWHLHYEAQREGNAGTMRLYGVGNPATASDADKEVKIPTDMAINFINELRASMINSTVVDKRVSNNEVASGYTHTGCVDLDYFYLTQEPNKKTYFSACIDCQPIVVASPAQFGLQHTDLQCVCPSF